ncbi:MAG: metal ABC transporter solute-binding protein, Zn/Mn family [Microbacteriaceae bacterium]
MRPARSLLWSAGIVGLVLVGCGDDDTGSGGGATVVVTTNILGDVVEAVAGDQLEVVTIMPVAADPHSFQASARQVDQMRRADALVMNGADFEEGLHDVIQAATDDGVPTFEAISAVETIELGEGGHDHSDGEDEHADEEDEGEEHDHEGVDPHFFTDPVRMAEAVDAMVEFLIDEVDGVDADALRAAADDYLEELEGLDAEIEDLLAGIDEDRRILVTNHEVFGYFADRYGFEVVGTVVPSGSTADGASARQLAELVEVIEHEEVPAIFADTSSSDRLAQTLADEVGDIEVVELFSESLGDESSEGATYLEMMRTNAERIASALSD